MMILQKSSSKASPKGGIKWHSAITLILCFFLSFMYSACSKDDKEEPEKITELPGNIPGLGPAPGQPQGSIFTLPEGVSLVEPLKGQEDGPSEDDCVSDGQGHHVAVKMKLRRDLIGSSPITVEFPAGLIIVSTSESYQHGLLIDRILVTLPPKLTAGDSPVCQVTLLLSCLNSSKDPSTNDATYAFGPVTSSPLVKELIQLLSNKKILYSAYPNNEADWLLYQGDIQEALWNITDGTGLTAEDRARIREIPSK